MLAGVLLAPSAALSAPVPDTPLEFVATSGHLQLLDLVVSESDQQPHVLVSIGRTFERGSRAALVVLRPHAEDARLESLTLQEDFDADSAVMLAVNGANEYAVAWGSGGDDIRIRTYARSGLPVAEVLAEGAGSVPRALLPFGNEFLLLTARSLLRVRSDGSIVHRENIPAGHHFGDAVLARVTECPLVTSVISGDDFDTLELQSRCQDGDGVLHVRRALRIASSSGNLSAHLDVDGAQPPTLVVTQPERIGQGEWRIARCRLEAVKEQCRYRTVVGVPQHIGLAIDGVQMPGNGDQKLIVSALAADAQSIWVGHYGPGKSSPERVESWPHPVVPGGYSIGHRLLAERAGDRAWLAVLYGRIRGDVVAKGEVPHSLIDMRLSLRGMSIGKR